MLAVTSTNIDHLTTHSTVLLRACVRDSFPVTRLIEYEYWCEDLKIIKKPLSGGCI